MSTARVVPEGAWVLIVANEDNWTCHRMQRNTRVNVAKGPSGTINCNDVIGVPYDSLFRIENKKLVPASEGDFTKMTEDIVGSVGEGVASNRHIVDDNKAQKLTQGEVKELRKNNEGDAGTIIKTLVQNSTSFASKTKYSQEKYIRRKMKKYGTRIKILEASTNNLATWWSLKGNMRILCLKPHTLGMLMGAANVHSGQRVMVIDECVGLLTSAVIERMGGYGRCLSGFLGQQPNLPVLANSCIPRTVQNMMRPFSVARAAQDLGTGTLKLQRVDPRPMPALTKDSAVPPEDYTIDRYDRHVQSQQWLAEGVESIVMATHVHPTNVFLAMYPLLAQSGHFAIYHQYIEPLTDLAARLTPCGIHVEFKTVFFREMMIKSDRSRPDMGALGEQGYMLSGIKVGEYDEEAYKKLMTTAPYRQRRKYGEGKIDNEDVKKDQKQKQKQQQQGKGASKGGGDDDDDDEPPAKQPRVANANE